MNKNPIYPLIILIAGTLMIYGCATKSVPISTMSSRNVTVGPDADATIILARDSGSYGMLVPVKVKIGDTFESRIERGKAIKVQVKSGSHFVQAASLGPFQSFDKPETEMVYVKSGDTALLRIGFFNGYLKLWKAPFNP